MGHPLSLLLLTTSKAITGRDAHHNPHTAQITLHHMLTKLAQVAQSGFFFSAQQTVCVLWECVWAHACHTAEVEQLGTPPTQQTGTLAGNVQRILRVSFLLCLNRGCLHSSFIITLLPKSTPSRKLQPPHTMWKQPTPCIVFNNTEESICYQTCHFHFWEDRKCKEMHKITCL